MATPSKYCISKPAMFFLHKRNQNVINSFPYTYLLQKPPLKILLPTSVRMWVWLVAWLLVVRQNILDSIVIGHSFSH